MILVFNIVCSRFSEFPINTKSCTTISPHFTRGKKETIMSTSENKTYSQALVQDKPEAPRKKAILRPKKDTPKTDDSKEPAKAAKSQKM